eukprot:scpid90282/ scgid1642/ 
MLCGAVCCLALQGGLESGLLAAGDVLARLGLAGDMCESDQPRPHRSTEHGHEQHRHSGKGDELSAETCDCTEKSTRKPIKSAARRHAARFLGAIWPRGRSLTHNCTCAVCRSMDCAGKHSRSAIANDTCHCDSSYSEGGHHRGMKSPRLLTPDILWRHIWPLQKARFLLLVMWGGLVLLISMCMRSWQ